MPDSYNWGSSAASPSGDRLAYSLDATHLAVYDMRDGRRIVSLTGVSGATVPQFSPGGRRIVGGNGREVRLWDASTGAVGRHNAIVSVLWFARDGQTLCNVDTGGILKLWRTADRP